jgi:outer membrane protein OmpA-like peptidoglycan-associated protein
MKLKPLILFSLLVLNSSLTIGQTFNWNDKEFKTKTIRDIRVMYQLGNIKLAYDSTNYKILDTIVRFLKNNPQLKVEIDNYVDKVDPRCCSRISQERAESVMDTLVKLGISPERVTAKGWGASKPLISKQEIEKMQTKEEKDAANAVNRRTEIVIIEK